MTDYLENATGPVSLVMDFRIDHDDRFGSIGDPSLNGHLHYTNDIDHRSSNVITFMPVIGSTSGRLHSEFVRLLFLQSHLETDSFFADSGVQFSQHDRGLFHFRRVAFSSQLKSKVGSTLTKDEALCVNFNIDGVPIVHKEPNVCESCRSLRFSF